MNTPLDVLNEWMHGINTGDVEKLLGLYDENAVLIPTFSNRLLNTHEKIKDYFEKVGQKEALSITLHDKTVQVQNIGENLYATSGIYAWHFSIDNEPLTFEARFSYVIDLAKNSPILNHHSSQIPRSL